MARKKNAKESERDMKKTGARILKVKQVTFVMKFSMVVCSLGTSEQGEVSAITNANAKQRN
jgi:hypothetical protein